MDKEYDFSTAKRATEIPHLNTLRQTSSAKSRITIMLYSVVMKYFILCDFG